MTNKLRGAIRALYPGYGYLTGDDGIHRFFHRSGLQLTTLAFDQLVPHMRVEFVHIDAPKGPRAIEVRVIPDEEQKIYERSLESATFAGSDEQTAPGIKRALRSARTRGDAA